MGFEPITGFLPKAFEKINQGDLAQAGMTCQRINTFFKRKYPQYNWKATKFEKGELTITTNCPTEGSLLFLETSKLMKRFHRLKLNDRVTGMSVKVV